MARARTLAARALEPPHADPRWDPSSNPALRELLDHLAEELAREYVRLMKEAAECDRLVAPESPPGAELRIGEES